MQSKEEIERESEIEDHWGYETNEWDTLRKNKILSKLTKQYERALDIGCHEGFITRDLPAKIKEGYELSDNAAKRLPSTILRVTEPSGEYDLIVATGIMYGHYDFRKFLDIIKKHAKGTVLLSNIKAWEVPEVAELGTPIHVEEYPYREYTQIMRIYEF